MKNSLIALSLAAAGWLAGMNAQAAPALSLVPSSTSINVGDNVQVDLVVSGLTSANEIVSGFDVDVFFDPSILSALTISTTFAPWGTGGDVTIEQNFISAGHIEVKLTALLGDAALDALQGDSVVLSTIALHGEADGFSTISYGLDPNFERRVNGRNDKVLNPATTDTCIAVGTGTCPAVSVPEPGGLPLALLALGVSGLALRRHKAIAA